MKTLGHVSAKFPDEVRVLTRHPAIEKNVNGYGEVRLTPSDFYPDHWDQVTEGCTVLFYLIPPNGGAEAEVCEWAGSED